MVFGGFNHTEVLMPRSIRARLAFRASAASALAVLLLLAASPATGPARAQEGERSFGLFDRIFGGSERLSGSGGAERSAPAAPDRTATVQSSGPDLMMRVDRLEAQIRQLTGVIEQLHYRNQQLEAYVRRMYEESGSRPGQPRPQALPPASPPATAAPGRRGDAFDPTQHPNAPGAPHTLGAVAVAGAPPPMGAPEQTIGAPGGRGAHAPLDLANMSPPGGAPPAPPPRSPSAGGAVAALPSSPRDEFDLAYGHVLRKDYVHAEEGFRNFLSKYPNDRLAGDATYWFGESLFQRQRFRDAAEAFLNVSTKYEANARAPDALLRLGQSLAALGEKEAACASLGEVLRKYPRASAAVKQGVEREQKRARC
jgi:tol-pal system protein YbgF